MRIRATVRNKPLYSERLPPVSPHASYYGTDTIVDVRKISKNFLCQNSVDYSPGRYIYKLTAVEFY